MNIPNRLTLARILAVPVFLLLLYLPFPGHRLIALIVFLLAAGTDVVDGYLARRFGQVTNFGKLMDPLADKLLTLAALLWFVEQHQMPAWVVLIVAAREFAVTTLRLVAVDCGRIIPAGLSGKVKTASSLLCICLVLTDLARLQLLPWLSLNTIFTAIILLTTVWSGIVYFYRNRDLLCRSA